MPCMAHVLNLALQGGLKELGNLSLTLLYSNSEAEEECEENEVEVTSQRPFGATFHQLQKLVLAAKKYTTKFISIRHCAKGIICQTQTY